MAWHRVGVETQERVAPRKGSRWPPGCLGRRLVLARTHPRLLVPVVSVCQQVRPTRSEHIGPGEHRANDPALGVRDLKVEQGRSVALDLPESGNHGHGSPRGLGYDDLSDVAIEQCCYSGCYLR